jgi:cell division inhibitor SepF
MSALRKAGVWLGLIEDDEDGYTERGYDHRGYDDYEDEEEVAPVRRGGESSRARVEHTDADTGRPHSRLAEAVRAENARAESLRESLRSETTRTPVRPVPRPSTSSETTYPTRDNLALAPQVQVRERPPAPEPEERGRYQITTLHPTTYHEARTVGEHFRDGVPVIMNLTEMAESDARRLVDFAAGLAFGLRGSMERVTNRVFLLSPANVQVTPEDKMKIAEGGFFTT